MPCFVLLFLTNQCPKSETTSYNPDEGKLLKKLNTSKGKKKKNLEERQQEAEDKNTMLLNNIEGMCDQALHWLP